MADKSWIEEQKEIHGKLFAGGGRRGTDADRMLEHGGINKSSYPEQTTLKFAVDMLGKALGIDTQFTMPLIESVEVAQMHQDSRAREDFKKVAIEQWQGKIQALKNKALLQAVSQ